MNMSNGSPFYRHMGVYGICLFNEQLLVIHKRLGPYVGRYDLPGGRLEEGETLEDGIQREIREETGFTVTSLETVGACDFNVWWIFKDGSDEHVHHIAILFKIEVNPDEAVKAIEVFEEQDSNGFVWLPIKDVNAANCSPLVLQALEWIRTRTLPVKAQSYDYRSNEA